jgi:hypothetical protein
MGVYFLSTETCRSRLDTSVAIMRLRLQLHYLVTMYYPLTCKLALPPYKPIAGKHVDIEANTEAATIC